MSFRLYYIPRQKRWWVHSSIQAYLSIVSSILVSIPNTIQDIEHFLRRTFRRRIFVSCCPRVSYKTFITHDKLSTNSMRNWCFKKYNSRENEYNVLKYEMYVPREPQKAEGGKFWRMQHVWAWSCGTWKRIWKHLGQEMDCICKDNKVLL